MSSLWTPSGEHPVDDRGPTAPTASETQRPAASGNPPPFPDRGAGSGQQSGVRGAVDPDEGRPPTEAELDALRRELASAPAAAVVANHCYGLFELAALYLSERPPKLDEARLAIDALGYLIDGLGDRIGEPSGPLRDALAQIRLAFVQVEGAARTATSG